MKKIIFSALVATLAIGGATFAKSNVSSLAVLAEYRSLSYDCIEGKVSKDCTAFGAIQCTVIQTSGEPAYDRGSGCDIPLGFN